MPQKHFRRMPRSGIDLPTGELPIELPSVPALAPIEGIRSTQILQMVVPGVVALTSAAVQAFTGIGTPMSWILTVPMGLIPALTYFDYRHQHKLSREQRAQAIQIFKAQLAAREREINTIVTRQQRALAQMHPSAQEGVRMAQRLDPLLWARDPYDADFLAVRLGEGDVRLMVEIRSSGNETGAPLDRDVQDMLTRFERVRQAPVVAPLAEWGATRIVAHGEEQHQLARLLAMQIAFHHSPDDVKVIAIYPEAEHKRWEWMAQLPHARLAGRDEPLVTHGRKAAEEILNTIYNLLSRVKVGAADRGWKPATRYVLFLADQTIFERDPHLKFLMTEGIALGCISLVFATTGTAVRECRGVIEWLGGISSVRPAHTASAAQASQFQPDALSADQVRSFARALAEIELDRPDQSAPIPKNIFILDMLGVQTTAQLATPERWQASLRSNDIAVPIGRMAGGRDLVLNLHDGSGPSFHGAHMLVAGTTGAGKSRLLHTILLSLAMHLHPHRMSFFTIDFKGNAMAQYLKDLPHLRGSISDMDKASAAVTGGLLNRTIVALRSELAYRKQLFEKAGVDYIDDYQDMRDHAANADPVLPPLPRLVIVVDEFRELKMQYPDVLEDLISVATTGRSLGVHLILATQQPSGLVDPQTLSNIRSVLCLKMASSSDSAEVLHGRTHAADIEQQGFGYLLVGENDWFEGFQTAFAPYRIKCESAKERENAIEHIAQHLQRTAAEMAVSQLPPLWVAPLPNPQAENQPHPTFAHTWAATEWQPHPPAPWLQPKLGLLDDPHARTQDLFHLNLGDMGHLAVFGRQGSGKTTFVQSLVVALARQHTPAELQAYVLDFNSQTLQVLEALPQVGSVIFANDGERVERLFRMLRKELVRRKQVLRLAGTGTRFSDYRARAALPENVLESMPALLLVIDGYATFWNDFESELECLVELLSEGTSAGIHVVLTSVSTQVASRVLTHIRQVVTFELEDGDYYSAVGRTGEFGHKLEPAPIPGRGLVKRVKPQPPLEFQAWPALGVVDDAERLLQLRALGENMAQHWDGPLANPIEVLDVELPLEKVLHRWRVVEDAQHPRNLPVGLVVDDLTPFLLNLSQTPHGLIVGDAQTGKTTALMTLACAASHCLPNAGVYLCDLGQNDEGLSTLQSLDGVNGMQCHFADSVEALTTMLHALRNEVDTRRKHIDQAKQSLGRSFDAREFANTFSPLLLLIDDYRALGRRVNAADTTALDELAELLVVGKGAGLHLFLAGLDEDLNSIDAPEFVVLLRNTRVGLVLGSTDCNTLSFFTRDADPEPGEGYWVHRSKGQKVKIAMPVAPNTSRTSA